MKPACDSERITRAHRLYCRMTGQSLSLGFDRQRMWYELMRQGFDLNAVQRVIRYLQREIRHGRRNVGALKLTNLLQPDRFEEDLAISRVRLTPPPKTAAKLRSAPLDPKVLELKRRQSLERIRQLRDSLND